MTARHSMRPRRVVELDGIPIASWPVEDEGAVFLWQGRLWSKEKVGCVLCTERDGPEFVTLCTADEHGKEQFHCIEHGELVEIPFSMSKLYTIKIGDVLREGEESLNDTMLFPAEMVLVARNELIESLLDDAERQEHEEGPAPSD